MSKAPVGIHPKWISCFPHGSYFGWDGVSDDPEEPEEEVRTFLYREGQVVEQEKPKQLDFRDVLKELGF